jgi:hypothetical protein
MPEQVRYQTKLIQFGIFLVRYRTKIRDARMLMLALVSSMLMPSYVYNCMKNGAIVCTQPDSCVGEVDN